MILLRNDKKVTKGIQYMKKVSTLFLCTLLTLVSCLPQKAYAIDSTALRFTYAASGVSLGVITGCATPLVMFLIAMSYDNPHQNRECTAIRGCMATVLASGYIASGLLIAKSIKG